MSMDLKPRNNSIEEFRISGIYWNVVLRETGAGYIIGYGKAVSNGAYSYKPQGNNGSPMSNDGYRVTAFEAKAMALSARGYLSEQSYLKREWAELDKEKRKMYELLNKNNDKGLFNKPAGDTFIKVVERFANFAEQSSGFRIT